MISLFLIFCETTLHQEIPTFTDTGFQFSVSNSLPYNSEKNDFLYIHFLECFFCFVFIFILPHCTYLVLDKSLVAYVA